MFQDAIVMLKDDHKEVRSLFREFQKSSTTRARKGRLVEQIIELLTVHTYVENEVMYPQVRALLPDPRGRHAGVLRGAPRGDYILVMELAGMSPKDERFVAKATVLIESVTHHMEEEEQDWFPKVRAGLSRTQLREIGAELAEAKAKAPRHPEQPTPSRRQWTRSSPRAAVRRRGAVQPCGGLSGAPSPSWSRVKNEIRPSASMTAYSSSARLRMPWTSRSATARRCRRMPSSRGRPSARTSRGRPAMTDGCGGSAMGPGQRHREQREGPDREQPGGDGVVLLGHRRCTRSPMTT